MDGVFGIKRQVDGVFRTKLVSDLGLGVKGARFPLGDARLEAPLHLFCLIPHFLQLPFELLAHLPQGVATAGQYLRLPGCGRDCRRATHLQAALRL